MTQKHSFSAAQPVTPDPRAAAIPTSQCQDRNGAALMLERGSNPMPPACPPLWQAELADVLDHHRPKRLQAFDEMQRLMESGQTQTQAFAEAKADLDWHNQACLGAIFTFLRSCGCEV